MKSDPVIDEIRRVRAEISAEFGHDIRRLVEHYINSQKRHGKRLVEPPEREPGKGKPRPGGSGAASPDIH